ncbi:MAG: DUF481 domain-containing protein, partial [Pseudomonadota bacterium]|nr:DUF481 domain-containing protein [Pseudomonadota bacterium]
FLMNKKYLSLLCGLSLWAVSAPIQAADKVFLHNGDHFTGEITSYEGNNVTIKTSYGQFDLPIDLVKGVYADGQARAAQIAAHIAVQQAALQDVAPVTAMPPVDAALAQQEKIAAAADAAEADDVVEDTGFGFWGADFSGNVNLGYDLKRGNSENSALNIDATVLTTLDKHDLKFKGEYNREEDGDTVSVDNRHLSINHDYNFTDRWFIGSKVKFTQDDLAQLDLRTNASTGIGYHIFKRDDLDMKFVVGPGYLHEKFENDSDDSEMTYNWAFDYKQKFYDDLFRLFHEHSLNAPTEDTEAYLFESQSGIRVPIRRGIVATGQVDFDWDNDPAAGTVEDDTTYSFKLGYEWP